MRLPVSGGCVRRSTFSVNISVRHFRGQLRGLLRNGRGCRLAERFICLTTIGGYF